MYRQKEKMAILETIISASCRNGLTFTSVCISNKMKQLGMWLSNSEVSSFLRTNISRITYEEAVDYTRSLMWAGNNSAFVYYPTGTDIDDIDHLIANAMTPKQFERLHGFNPIKSQTDKRILNLTNSIVDSLCKLMSGMDNPVVALYRQDTNLDETKSKNVLIFVFENRDLSKLTSTVWDNYEFFCNSKNDNQMGSLKKFIEDNIDKYIDNERYLSTGEKVTKKFDITKLDFEEEIQFNLG